MQQISTTSDTLAPLLLTVLLCATGCESREAPSDDARAPTADVSLHEASFNDAASSDAAPPILDAQDDGGDSATGERVYEVATSDSTIIYRTDYPAGMNRDREVIVRVWYPLGRGEEARVIVVSHGGPGSSRGYTRLTHLGQEYASRGYVAIHMNHSSSPSTLAHLWDRPADVSAVLDALAAGEISLPVDFGGSLRFDEVGHIGHSLGAYTSHAISGASLTDPSGEAGSYINLQDTRVVASATLSPQGYDQFGFYDEVEDLSAPSENNSWRGITIPTFNLVGEREKDGTAGVEDVERCPECFRATDWRLFPFMRYPEDGQRYLSIIPGGTHSDLGNEGSDEVRRYIATNTRIFFDVFLRGEESLRERIGREMSLADLDHRRR